MNEKKLKGKLFLHSDQGMEGACLALQDLSFIDFQVPIYGLKENRKVYDNKIAHRNGITSNPEMLHEGAWIPLRDPLLDDPDYKLSSLWLGEKRGDFDADKRLMMKYDFQLLYIEDGTPESFPKRPYSIPTSDLVRVTVTWNDATIEENRLSNSLHVESWNYEGLHILNEDDFIKVLEPITEKTICQGVINQIPLRVFSQTLDGHFNQGTSDWKKFFQERYIAEVTRKLKTTTNNV